MRLAHGGSTWHTVLSVGAYDNGRHPGFVSGCVTTSGEFLVGFGEEPYYYAIRDVVPASVSKVDPTTGGIAVYRGPQPFQGGAYLIRDVPLRLGVPLRQYPRDDGLTGTSAPRQNPTPTSSIRQGWQNRIK